MTRRAASVGDRVCGYEIRRVIARGGMAVVYLAHQPARGRDVALKALDVDRGDASTASRFVREARLTASLDHPNIVTLFDFFEANGVPYLAMELVTGGALRAHIGHLALPQVLVLLDGILTGLCHAESRRVAHRDLKPDNVLVTARGTAKIADFGIARAYEALTQRLTATGVMLGTPAYMAPEQVQGGALGPQTDLYAVGVMAYEMLAGVPPFSPELGAVALLYRHVHDPVPPLAARAPHVPPALCRWVECLLAKDPADRPASAADALRRLDLLAVDRLARHQQGPRTA